MQLKNDLSKEVCSAQKENLSAKLNHQYNENELIPLQTTQILNKVNFSIKKVG
jgi:hypothetical protein